MSPELPGLPNVTLQPAGDAPGWARAARGAAVVIVDASMLDRAGDLAALPPHVIVVAADAASNDALGARVDISLEDSTRPRESA